MPLSIIAAAAARLAPMIAGRVGASAAASGAAAGAEGGAAASTASRFAKGAQFIPRGGSQGNEGYESRSQNFQSSLPTPTANAEGMFNSMRPG